LASRFHGSRLRGHSARDVTLLHAELRRPNRRAEVDVVHEAALALLRERSRRRREAAQRMIRLSVRVCGFIVLPILVLGFVGLRAKAVEARTAIEIDPIEIDHSFAHQRPIFDQIVFGALFRNAPYSGFAETEAAAGRRLGIVEFGQPFDRRVDRRALRMIHAHGSIPMVTWLPWTFAYGRKGGNKQPLEAYALRKLYDGTYDDVIRREARDLAEFTHPVILRFAPEMNGFWYPWSEAPTGNIYRQHKNSNQLGDFVKAWRHIHDLFEEEGATNVIWNWSPNIWYWGMKYPFKEYFPGDRYVDLVGIDGYNWGTMRSWSKWATPDEVFGYTLAAVRRLSRRPIILSETASAEQGGDKAVWIHQLFRYLRTNRDIVAFLWFDFEKETDWRINSSSQAGAAFRSEMGEFVSRSPGPLLRHFVKRDET
jgi:hypothetical protein